MAANVIPGCTNLELISGYHRPYETFPVVSKVLDPFSLEIIFAGVISQLPVTAALEYALGIR